MKTKAFQKFQSRISCYDSDVELCDLLTTSFQEEVGNGQKLAPALGGNKNEHPVLTKRKDTQGTRIATANHLRNTLAAAYIKDLYEDFYGYLKAVLTSAAVKGVHAETYLGTINVTLGADEILDAGNWENAVSTISDKLFRRLEGKKSTRLLIKDADRMLGLNVDVKVIDRAMPYLDARHVLVHHDGEAHACYRGQYPDVATKNGKIMTDFAFIRNAKSAVEALALHFDEKIIAVGLLPDHAISGNAPA